MAAQGVFWITEEFERTLCNYTGAPYAVAIDNCSNALFLALIYVGISDQVITIPSRTYPSVPCAIIHAGGRVAFDNKHSAIHDDCLQGPYQLKPSPVWDYALWFSANIFRPGRLICLSFTGSRKHLKLGKGGAILTDDAAAEAWFKRARFSGRRECSYREDQFDMLGWNFYMTPDVAARGLLLMKQFTDGNNVINPELKLSFPDLSQFPIYRQELAMEVGQGTHISPKASIYGAERIKIGRNCRIDDFAILSAGAGGIELGDNVHIGCYTSLIGQGKITIEDGVGLSGRVSIYSTRGDVVWRGQTANPCLPKGFEIHAPVILRKGCSVTCGCVVLPGAEIGEQTVVGAMSLVPTNAKLDPGWIYIGCPARRMKQTLVNDEEQHNVDDS